MSRALAAFADHCQRMADSNPEDRLLIDLGPGAGVRRVRVGQISDTDRDLWRRLAEEITCHLSDRHADDTHQLHLDGVTAQ